VLLPRLLLPVVLAALVTAMAFGLVRDANEPGSSVLSDTATGNTSQDLVAGNSAPQVPPTPCPSCGQDESLWRSQTANPPPEPLGQAVALIEAGCGRLIYGKDSASRRPAASLVKIATALVAVDQGRLSDIVDIQINGWDLAAEDGSSIMGLQAGMQLTVEELVWGLLLMSGNDAANELARHFGGGERFVALMNAKASSLGLSNTRFRNPHGLDADGAYSTAFELTILGKTLLADPLLSTMAVTQHHETAWKPDGIWNGNWLLYIYPDAIGIKTGYTEAAGGTIVAAATRDGRTLIASVLNSADVFWDSMRLFDWAFANTRDVC
jgi:D-alanyl-D-alanine carboxypeptidase